MLMKLELEIRALMQPFLTWLNLILRMPAICLDNTTNATTGNNATKYLKPFNQ